MDELAESIQYATKQQYGGGTIPDQCFPYFQHHYTHLNYYDSKPFVPSIMDYKNLDIIVDVFKGLVGVVLKVDKLFSFFDQIYLHFKDGIKVDMGLMSILVTQIGFLLVVVVLVVLLGIVVAGIVLTILGKVKGSGQPPTQEISVSRGAGRLCYAGLMAFLVIIIFTCSLVGLVGNMAFKQSKTTYVDFAGQASDHLISYLTNITTDMRTISDKEFRFLTDNIEADFYRYQMIAAEHVKELEEPRAVIFNRTAVEGGQLENDITDTIVSSLDILQDIYDLASPARATLTSCHAGVTYFCTIRPSFCNDIFNAANIEPITPIDTVTWPYRVTMETILSYKIPDVAYENWKMCSRTVEDLMDFNEPVRVEQQKHHQKMREWLGSSFKKAEFLLNDNWIKKIRDAGPAKDLAYDSSSDFSGLVQIMNWVLVGTYFLTFITAIVCMALYTLGLCVSDSEAIPTKRSATSNAIATVMTAAAGLTAIQVVVVLALTIPFLVVASMAVGSCEATNGSEGQNPFWLWDNGTLTTTPSLISTAIRNTEHSELQFWDLVKGCQEDRSLYNLLSLDNVLATGELFEVREFLGIRRYCDNSGITPYSTVEETKLATAILETDVTVDDAARILPYLDDLTVTERKLVRLPEGDYQQFLSKVNQAIASLGHQNGHRATLGQCRQVISNLDDSWKVTTDTIGQKFAAYSSKVTTDPLLIPAIQQYHAILLESDIRAFFGWTESKYKLTMKEANIHLDSQVECHRDIARHQTESILGRCRPLYDLYLGSYSLVCEMITPSLGLVTISLMGLSLAMTLFLVNLVAVIPYFRKMELLHGSDVEKLEVEKLKVVKTDI